MATKTTEPCPICDTITEPKDRALAVDSLNGTYPVKMWRYVCSCGWTWANVAQRHHNNIANRRAIHAAFGMGTTGL